MKRGFVMSDLQLYIDKVLKEVQLVNKENEPIIMDYDIGAEICEIIIKTRTLLGMTQKQLAEKSAISQANISRIENGSYCPSIQTLKRIADGLGKRLIIDFVDREEVL